MRSPVATRTIGTDLSSHRCTTRPSTISPECNRRRTVALSFISDLLFLVIFCAGHFLCCMIAIKVKFTLRLSCINKTPKMQSAFWWVWLLTAGCVWILQRLISGRSDKTVPENELTLSWGAVRIVLITVMIFCFALSLILFIEWVRADSHRLALQRSHALL